MTLKTGVRGDIPAFLAMEVLRTATLQEQAGNTVYHMEVGQPGTGAPKGVIEAAHKTLEQDRIGYTTALGLPDLRKAISRHYTNHYGIEVGADRIVVTTGSSCGFILSFLAAFNPGDRVALVAPGYPCYRHILKALDIDAVILKSGPEDGFQPTEELLDHALLEGPLEGLIIASPSNPTGTMLTRDQLQALVKACQARGIRVISDEIYHGITFDVEETTAAELDPEAIVVNSFSKYFSMTGWRLGWLVIPESLARAVESLAQNLFISSPTLSQIAGIAAFECHVELQENVQRYAANRTLLTEALPQLGFPHFAPSNGAFYIYADIAHMADDSQTFCAHILKETGVAITPGIDFDTERGHQTVRFSYAGASQEILGAIEALKGLNLP